MLSALVEVGGLEFPGAQFNQVLRAQMGELVQQLRDRFALDLSNMSLAIEGVEGPRLAVPQDDEGAGYPIGTLGVIEMPDHVEGGPGVFAFVGVSEGLGQI